MIPHIVAGRIAIARIVATMVVWTLTADSFAHQVINLWNILIPSFRGFDLHGIFSNNLFVTTSQHLSVRLWRNI